MDTRNILRKEKTMNFEETNGIQTGNGLKVVIYGQEGVGKSTLASQFPGAVFIDCEGSTTRMNVRRLPRPTSWEMLNNEMSFILEACKVKDYQTVIIDTFDWAERLALETLCSQHNISGIEGMNYGKGWEYEKEMIGRFLDSTDRLTAAGVNIVLLCHAITRKTTLPEEMEEYDHWELKLGNKTTNKIAPLLKEWSDMTLFLAFQTHIEAMDDKGRKHKATSCQRVMYTTKTAWWDAKNRFGLPDRLPLAWKSIAPIFSNAPVNNTVVANTIRPDTPPAPQTVDNVPADTPPAQQLIEKAQGASIPTEPTWADITPDDDFTGIAPALADLMKANEVSTYEIEHICSEVKNYMPKGMPIKDYPEDFVQGCLIGAWQQVYAEIIKARESLPFK